MEWMKQLKSKYVSLPKEYVYVNNEDVESLEQGRSVLAYLDITGRDHKDYTLMTSLKFQPAIKVDENTYDVVYILI